MLRELAALGALRVYAIAAHEEEMPGKKYVFDEISGLERHMQRPDVPDELKPVIAFELGLAYVDAAMAEETDNNKEAAAKYMQSAQPVMKSLAWHDSSEETLKTFARRQLGEWNAQSLTKENTK